MFRTSSRPLEVKLYGENGKKFTIDVSLLAKTPSAPANRFGVNRDDVENFVNDILALQVDGKKFRTKYLIAWENASSLAETFLWTVMANKEWKDLTHTITYAKPTTQHWIQFAKAIIKDKTFKFWIDKAFTQALWQFVCALPSINVKGSTSQAKCNSVLTLVYINATRMIFIKLLDNDKDGLFSTKFTSALAKCTTDEEMVQMVKNDFGNYFHLPTEDEKKFPSFNDAQPVLQLVLDYLAKHNMHYQRNSVMEVFKKVIY